VGPEQGPISLVRINEDLLLLLFHLALQPWVSLALLDNQFYPRLVVRFLNNNLFTG
jgi:hypothetical protein